MGLGTFLRNLFRPLIRALWSFLKIIFKAGTEILMAKLRELAIITVAEVAEDPTLITDEDKRKAAFERLKKRALDKGIDARDSLINVAIELSVNYLKEKDLL